jgi:UDP-N-acetyl-D-galactosamine dehydrogenase
MNYKNAHLEAMTEEEYENYIKSFQIPLRMITAKIGVIGLGYVGLPLAVEFSKKFKVVGFDTNQLRIQQLTSGFDTTLELSSDELWNSELQLTNDINDLKSCNVYIVTVPTPIDRYNRPDLTMLLNASKNIGSIIKKNDTVIYESTVYPGATEEECIPEIEKASGLKYNIDFFAGYSPERINPGDKEHKFTNIKKVTSGSTPEIAEFVDKLYKSVVIAGTHKASSIKVAEAAKVIENTQRDLNIALINELAIIFKMMDVDTEEVLEAAGSKWNFLPFRPGLVGGHCIGVDPYYLTHKAQSLGYHPEVILSGRRINDNMGNYVAHQIINLMIRKNINIANSNILVMGITFKENCPDLRNSKVFNIIFELESFNANIDIYDPWADGIDTVLVKELKENYYDAIILAVAHNEFIELGIDKIKSLGKENHVLYDIKYLFDANQVDGRL